MASLAILVECKEQVLRVHRVLSVGVAEGSSLTGVFLCIVVIVVRAVVVAMNLGGRPLA